MTFQYFKFFLLLAFTLWLFGQSGRCFRLKDGVSAGPWDVGGHFMPLKLSISFIESLVYSAFLNVLSWRVFLRQFFLWDVWCDYLGSSIFLPWFFYSLGHLLLLFPSAFANAYNFLLISLQTLLSSVASKRLCLYLVSSSHCSLSFPLFCLFSTVHMRLYSMKKMHVFFYVITFMTVIFLSVVAGIMGPPVLTRSNHYATKILPEERTLYNGFYKVTSDPVMLFQREIWFSSVIHQKNPDGKPQKSLPLRYLLLSARVYHRRRAVKVLV